MVWEAVWQDKDLDGIPLGHSGPLPSVRGVRWSLKSESGAIKRILDPHGSLWARVFCMCVAEKFYLQLSEYKHSPCVVEVSRFWPWICSPRAATGAPKSMLLHCMNFSHSVQFLLHQSPCADSHPEITGKRVSPHWDPDEGGKLKVQIFYEVGAEMCDQRMFSGWFSLLSSGEII